MATRNLQTDAQYEDGPGYDELVGIVGGAPAPAPAAPPILAPDWSQGNQVINGLMYQPIYDDSGNLQEVLRYQPGQIGAGQSYEKLNPTTLQAAGTGKFKEVGNALDLAKSAALDVAPLATFALGVGPLGGMLGGSIASALGIPVATATSAGLTAAQVAALGSAAGGAGITALQGGNLEDVLKSAVTTALPSFVLPQVKEFVGNAIPDVITGNQIIDNALAKGARDLAGAATSSVIRGQDLDVVNALLPSVVSGITDATGLPAPVVQLGLRSLIGEELTPEGIFKTIVQNAPKIKPDLKAEAPQEAGAGYGGADQGYFDAEEAQAVQDDIDSILARYPEAAAQILPEVPTFSVTAQRELDFTDLADLGAPAPAPAEQRVEIAAKKAEPLPVEFYETELEPEVLGGMPMDDTQRYTATGKLPEQTFYELPEAPAVQDLYQPPGELEGPSKLETTGKRETPEPIYEQPPTPEPEPIYEQPPTPAPTPPAPGPAPRPPSPAPAPAAQSPDLSSLLSLLGRGQGAQTTYNPVLFQGQAIDLDKLFGYREPSSLDELLAMIGQKPRG